MNAIDEAALLKMAEAEILGESKRAAIRHSISGIAGWQPCPKPNKIFLTNTLLQTMASNRLLSRKRENKKENGSKPKKIERKFLQKNKKSERANIIYKKPQKKVEKIFHKSTKSKTFEKNITRQKINDIKKSTKDDKYKH